MVMESVPTHFFHVILLNPDLVKDLVDHLLPSRAKVQMLMLGLKKI